MEKTLETSKKISSAKQITVYKTDKRLIEIIDCLSPATSEVYASVHNDNGIPSYLKINTLDYSNKSAVIDASFNISPENLRWLYLNIRNKAFNWNKDKINPYKTLDGGLNPVSKIVITRHENGTDGKPRNYPWTVTIENGTGRCEKNGNGGTKIASGSYMKLSSVSVYMNDEDYAGFIIKISRFLDLFECAYAPKAIREGRAVVDALFSSYQSLA